MPRPSSHLLYSSIALLIVLAGAASPPSASGMSLSHQVTEEIRTILAAPHPPRLVLGSPVYLNDQLLPDFYRDRDFRPAWIGDLGLTPAAWELLDLLRGAGVEGLCPEDYHLLLLEPLVGLERDYRPYGILFDPGYMAHLDLLLTDAFLLYASDLMNGRVDPETLHEGWHARRQPPDLSRLLGEALNGRGVTAVVESLVPPHEGYRRLRIVLEDYRRISAMGGWPAVQAGPVLRPGARDSRLPLLKARLRLSGDLAETEDAPEDFFDAKTKDALIRFQSRHGLSPDGVLGQKTRAALNVPVEDRIRRIEINLERWRWVRQNLGRRYLMVNIADFRLEVVEAGRSVMSMPVVVGTSYRKTPVFSARMTYLEFAPYWTVPATILREDKLPLIKKNPDWLTRHQYEIVPWSGGGAETIDPAGIDWKEVEANTFPGYLRMKPGPWNPLGRIKFMFPNRFAVYLHDTPDRYLFARDIRSYSSGCIRVERPLDLAQYLLERTTEWDCNLILDALESDEPLTVNLPASWPIHILYWTAWVDEEGALQLRDDFYLSDLDLELALIRSLDRTKAEAGKLLTAGS